MASDGERPTIFLSYAHGDQAQAQRLAAALERCGFTVWWDALIEGGTRYAKSIDTALAAADAVVVLWSQQSVESDWVKDEAAQGRERHRLVPLSLDGTLPPLGFRQLQVIDLSGWRGRADAPQFDAIRRAVATASGQAPVERQRIAGPRVSRRQALAGGAGVAAIVAGGGGLIAWQKGWLGGEGAERSIAVLPFKNVGGNPAQAYLSEGLTEEVRAALSRNARLQVLAATSSDTARDDSGGATAIAAKLGVAYLLSGSVQRSGDRVRVAMDLTDGKTGFSKWSQQIDQHLTDIFAFQTAIARTVSNALSVKMATDEPAPGGTRNVAAYEAYLRGKALYNLSKDVATDREAQALYENAIAGDSKFALAHAALSRVLSSIASVDAPANEIKSTFAAAIAEGRAAVDLAPKLAEAQVALGYALFAGHLDIKGSRAAYDLAYRYGNGNADILLLYALYTVRARRFATARSAIERAVALDPLNPRAHRAAGSIGFATRDYAGAVEHFNRALELNPDLSNAHAMLGYCLIQLGQFDAARAALAKEPMPMMRLTGQSILEHRAGKPAEAQRAFASLVKDVGDTALYQQAEVMAQWGRADDAMALLERARGVGDAGLTAITSDPFLDPLARDRRFRLFVRQMRFA
ncbi:MAG: TIR domain-containing protein [Sphingomicrobium sp.]